LAFTKGLLIHVNPNDIGRAYDKLYACSARYILVCEYFSAMETPVAYRGEQDRLWKRDFGREIGERFPGLTLLDYGFAGNCGNWPQDDLNWWLWSK
jgi:spore coat polysaccharide biosynthesis protein SpsF